MKKHLLFIFLLILLSIPSIISLLNEGYFPMHDDTQIERVIVMGRALRNGQFPVRWVSDLGFGYGYPIFNFYGPLAYYVGGFIYMLGLSALTSTKLMMMLGCVLSGISMYALVSRTLGKISGLVAGVLCVYAPYHAVQLYVRGAIGELWVLVFLPLVLQGINSIWIEKNRSFGVLVGGLGLAGVILSHTILGFTTVLGLGMFLVATSLVSFIRKNSSFPIGSLYLLYLSGLGMSAFFWLPAIFEMGYTSVSGQIGPTAKVLDHFVCLQQLFYSQWGFGGSVPGCADGLSFAIGKITLVLFLSGFIGLLVSWKNKSVRTVGVFGIFIVIISVFLMLEQSSFFWRILPGLSYVQYPWRFLVYTVLGSSIVSVIFLSAIRSTIVRLIISCVIIGSVIGVNSKFFVPQYSYAPDYSALETDKNIRFRASKISDEYLPTEIPRPEKSEDIIKEMIPSHNMYTLKTVVDKETYKKAEFVSQNELNIILAHAYFPGWEIWVNNTKQPLVLDHGRPIITLPTGFSTLQMWFKDTPIRTVGNIISLITVVLLMYIYGKKTFR